MQDEMYYYNDNFYNQIVDIIDDLDFKESPEELPDDFQLEYQECQLEVVHDFNLDRLVEILHDHNEDRYTDDDDWNEQVDDKLRQTLEHYIDFETIQLDLPKLWYPQKQKLYLNKQDIIKLWE